MGPRVRPRKPLAVTRWAAAIPYQAVRRQARNPRLEIVPKVSVNSFSSTRLCPICGDAINAKATGRPPRFCSTYCRNKAAGLRRHARCSRALAEKLRALAEKVRAGQRHGYYAQTLEKQAADAEWHARRLLAEIGEAPTEEGDDAIPYQSVGESSGNPCPARGEKHCSETPESSGRRSIARDR